MDSGKVPLPTLYNGSGSGHDPSGSGSSDPRRPRLGAIEMLLYNMSSMLASVAAGYDVRLSNVLPIHPKLHPNK